MDSRLANAKTVEAAEATARDLGTLKDQMATIRDQMAAALAALARLEDRQGRAEDAPAGTPRRAR